jgi:hypothetical protein
MVQIFSQSRHRAAPSSRELEAAERPGRKLGTTGDAWVEIGYMQRRRVNKGNSGTPQSAAMRCVRRAATFSGFFIRWHLSHFAILQ